MRKECFLLRSKLLCFLLGAYPAKDRLDYSHVRFFFFFSYTFFLSEHFFQPSLGLFVFIILRKVEEGIGYKERKVRRLLKDMLSLFFYFCLGLAFM